MSGEMLSVILGPGLLGQVYDGLQIERQLDSFQLIKDFIHHNYQFKDKDDARNMVTQVTGLYKNLNYSPSDSQDYQSYREEIKDLAAKYTVGG